MKDHNSVWISNLQTDSLSNELLECNDCIILLFTVNDMSIEGASQAEYIVPIIVASVPNLDDVVTPLLHLQLIFFAINPTRIEIESIRPSAKKHAVLEIL
ncbi:unnamed protein product [Rhizopus microsporus]